MHIYVTLISSFIFVIHIAVSMSLVVIAHLSNESNARRLRISAGEIITYGELAIAIKEQFPSEKVGAIEFYRDEDAAFKPHDPTKVVVGRFISCYLAVGRHNKEAPALIRGRAFDITEGFKLCGRTVSITDGTQRSLGTGLNTWDGAVVLAKYLEKNSHVVSGKRVLELGSGTGLAGIAAALSGADLTVLSDLPYALDNLWHNIHSNINESDINCRVFSRGLDWSDPKTYLFPDGVVSLDGSMQSGQYQEWDVILGADVVWVEDLVPSLVKALRALVGPSTTLILSHQVRAVVRKNINYSYFKLFAITSYAASILIDCYSECLTKLLS